MSDARARRSAIAVYNVNPYGNVDTTYDIASLAPSEQFEALVGMFEAIDAAVPAPYTQTPPYGEPIPVEEYVPEQVLEDAYRIQGNTQGYTDDEILPIISDAKSQEFYELNWENDPQYFGLGVPPGVPNWNQPVESGHTQITLLDPSAENGWDEWSGKPKIARVARHENDFKGYNKGTSRGHMVNVQGLSPRGRGPANYFTQQQRDLMLSELKKRGIHGVVIADVPTETYTDQVTWVDPATSGADAPMISEAGVL